MSNKELIDYFINETNVKFVQLEKKVDKLLEFKWQIIGGSLAASVFFTIGFQLIFLLLKE